MPPGIRVQRRSLRLGLAAIGLIVSQGVRPCLAGPGSTLLFRSGFEKGVYVNVPYVSGNQWWQDLRGADDSGFEWPFDLPDAHIGAFQYLVAGTETIEDWIETSIQNVTGPDGSPTLALFQNVKGDSPGNFYLTRNQYNLYTYNGTLERGYARYYLKLQPDLETVMPNNAWYWRLITELHENSSSGLIYRVHLFVKRAPGYPLFWELEATKQQQTIEQDWFEQNISVPVPVGEWFLFELFWNRSTGADGRIWMAVNGQALFDHYGRNKWDSSMTFWDCFKVYTGADSLAYGHAYQWIDNFEIHTEFPATDPPASVPALAAWGVGVLVALVSIAGAVVFGRPVASRALSRSPS
jgi:hypothetical protein